LLNTGSVTKSDCQRTTNPLALLVVFLCAVLLCHRPTPFPVGGSGSAQVAGFSARQTASVTTVSTNARSNTTGVRVLENVGNLKRTKDRFDSDRGQQSQTDSAAASSREKHGIGQRPSDENFVQRKPPHFRFIGCSSM
jgi:hypothetical protein